MVKRKIDEACAKEFKKIKQLTAEEVEPLIKLRTDLKEAIERVTRINQAFVRELNKKSGLSNRVKHVLKLTEDIHFHAECQRDIINKKVSNILNYKPVKKPPVKKKEDQCSFCEL